MTISKRMFEFVQGQVRETEDIYTYEELAKVIKQSESTVRDAIGMMDILGEVYIYPGRPVKFKYTGNSIAPEPGTIHRVVVTEQVVINHPEVTPKMIEMVRSLYTKIRLHDPDKPITSPEGRMMQSLLDMRAKGNSWESIRAVLLNAAKLIEDDLIVPDELEPSELAELLA